MGIKSSVKKGGYVIHIVWGSQPEKDSGLSTYSFNTQLELNAFIKGVKAAEGWLGYTKIEPEQWIKWKNSDLGIEYFS